VSAWSASEIIIGLVVSHAVAFVLGAAAMFVVIFRDVAKSGEQL
jgi:hypothetical protein